MNFRKYYIRENAWTLKTKFQILDEQDRIVYSVIGNKFALRSKLSFADGQGNELMRIEQKVFSLRPAFYLKRGDSVVCRVTGKFSLRTHILVESLDSNYHFEVHGNLWSNQYQFLRDDTEIAFVSSDIWKLSGSYGIAIHEGEDEAILLATVIIIHMINQEGSSV